MKTAIVAMLLATATVGYAAEIDYRPRIGETTEEYNVRTSGDPIKIEALRLRKEKEAKEAERCAPRTFLTTTESQLSGPYGTRNYNSEFIYRYVPGPTSGCYSSR